MSGSQSLFPSILEWNDSETLRSSQVSLTVDVRISVIREQGMWNGDRDRVKGVNETFSALGNMASVPGAFEA
jgi:hypothetical protein